MAHKVIAEICNFPAQTINKESISEVEICVGGVSAIQKTVIDSAGIEVITYKTTNGVALPTPTVFTYGFCPTVEPTPTQRVHQNFVVTGTTPLVIPAGAISISITKTNNTGIVNISGDNGTNFPLTANNENYSDGVNEAVSTLSAYTLTGTVAGTSYKVHIIR